MSADDKACTVCRWLAAERRATADDDHWYAYECHNTDCPESCARAGLTGVVLDVRLPGNRTDPPVAICPGCSQPMGFCGYWPADPDGYGSRGSRVRLHTAEDCGQALIRVAYSLNQWAAEQLTEEEKAYHCGRALKLAHSVVRIARERGFNEELRGLLRTAFSLFLEANGEPDCPAKAAP